MLGTNKGQLLVSQEEIAKQAGVDVDAPLTERQLYYINKFGVDPDKARITQNMKDFESKRISENDMLARGKGGEKALLPFSNEEGEELTPEQTSAAIKLNTSPQIARRYKNMTPQDEQEFIPKAEREALEDKNGRNTS